VDIIGTERIWDYLQLFLPRFSNFNSVKATKKAPAVVFQTESGSIEGRSTVWNFPNSFSEGDVAIKLKIVDRSMSASPGVRNNWPSYIMHTTSFPFTFSARPHRAGNPALIPPAMGASAVLSLPKILILALLASIQGALATATPFLPPVSQVEKVLLSLKNNS
jgi:hypothetical protein